MKKNFKDTGNRWRTQSLFIEFKREGYDAYWTIGDEDKEGYPSLKKIYMSYPHVPGKEWNFAKDTLGSWELWQRLLANKMLSPMFHSWQKEKEIELESMAIEALIKSAQEDGPKGTMAAKYIVEKGYKSSGKGRPTKESIDKASKEAAKERDVFEEDSERIGLMVIAGGRK